MARSSDSIHDVGLKDGSLDVRRVLPGERREALSVLLTGRVRAPVASVDSFLGFVSEQDLPLNELWAAYRKQQPIAAVLIVPGAGRTAMSFVSPITEKESVCDVGSLARAACSGQDSSNVRIIQTLLDPRQELEAQALETGGFQRLATLLYMQREIDTQDTSERLDESVEVLTWSEQHRSLFSDAILASYEDTMDCPALLGLRGIDDIIASHMAAGDFLPGLWFVVINAGKPLAVMLLNAVPQRDVLELVYLGVSPHARGCGWGERLVHFGLAQAAQRGVKTMLLAVDESNTPAKRLYERMAFTHTTRKLAMIYT